MENQNSLFNEILGIGFEEKLREARNATIWIIESNLKELAEKYNDDFDTFYKEFKKSLVELKTKEYKLHW